MLQSVCCLVPCAAKLRGAAKARGAMMLHRGCPEAVVALGPADLIERPACRKCPEAESALGATAPA